MDGDSAVQTVRLAVDRERWPLLSNSEPVRARRDPLWASTGDDFDLHLLTVAESVPGDRGKIRVAVAHVDGHGKNGSAIDKDTLAFDLFDW
jgi:hypothetical protein